jgi:hypothetical protein
MRRKSPALSRRTNEAERARPSPRTNDRVVIVEALLQREDMQGKRRAPCRAWRSPPTAVSWCRAAETGRCGSGTPGPVNRSGALEGHHKGLTSVAVSPDGLRIASGSEDGTVRWWPAPRAWPELLCRELNRNMTKREWCEWILPEIEYVRQCADLPVPVD